MKTILKKYRDFVIDLLFPPRCPVCRQILSGNDGNIHLRCEKKLVYVTEPICMRCGKPIECPQEEYCRDCAKRRHYYDSGRSVWVYEKHIRQSIVWYKYKHCREFSKFYIDCMLQRYWKWLKLLEPDVVMPIPLNRRKRRIRGYNQAEPLAAAVAEAIGCRMDTTTLIRSRWTAPQKELGPAERFANLKKAFEVDKKAVGQYRRVLLVDDIYTTGSTVDACAHQLKEAGVLEVHFLTLCIGSERN